MKQKKPERHWELRLKHFRESSGPEYGPFHLAQCSPHGWWVYNSAGGRITHSTSKRQATQLCDWLNECLKIHLAHKVMTETTHADQYTGERAVH